MSVMKGGGGANTVSQPKFDLVPTPEGGEIPSSHSLFSLKSSSHYHFVLFSSR